VPTRPDLGAAVNRPAREENRAPQPLSLLRPYTSQGVRGKLQAGYGSGLTTGLRRARRPLPRLYADRLCEETRLLPASPNCSMRRDKGLAWGIGPTS
jgi:hypothetical protein